MVVFGLPVEYFLGRASGRFALMECFDTPGFFEVEILATLPLRVCGVGELGRSAVGRLRALLGLNNVGCCPDFLEGE